LRLALPQCELCVFVVKLTGFPQKFRKTDCGKSPACTRSWTNPESNSLLLGELLQENDDMLPGSLASLKVVVVDDDPMIRMVVGRCLTHFGASATLCEDAVSGIQAVQQVRPQVVLADIIMPGHDGFYLLRQIKAFAETHDWRAGIVVITGVRDRDLEQALAQAGVVYLPKPFTPRDLFDAVRQAVEPFSLGENQLASASNAV
jgi:CheY-like chemotaxis protein